MAKLSWATFCERAVIDSSTNNLSLINVLEEVHPMRPTADQMKEAAGRVIGAALPCAFVSSWVRSKQNKAEPTTDVMIRLFDPKGKKLSEAKQLLDLKTGNRSRLVANLAGIPSAIEGTYVWRIYINQNRKWKTVGELTYEMTFINSAADVQRLQSKARKSAAKFASTIS